jgi:asparagine synthase (glutamine-hydrolysing)
MTGQPNTICAVSLNSPGDVKSLLGRMILTQSGKPLDDRLCFADASGRFGIAASGQFSGDAFYHDPGGRTAVVFSGRMINSDRLEDMLDASGGTINKGDAALAGRLFLQFGPDFVSKIHGPFNIIIWDSFGEQILVFRDQVGSLPLFYSAGTGNIRAISSRVEALVDTGIASQDLDHEAIYYFLCDKAFASDRTPFADVKGLLPGHRLTMDLSRFTTERYYRVPVREIYMSEDEAVDRAEALLIEVLEENISRAERIGLLLSGGVDSLLLLGVVRSITDKPVHTYSVFLDEEGKDEEYTRKASAHFETVHREIKLDRTVFRDNIVELINGYPTPAVGAWHIYFGTRAAGMDGVRSVITGFGGELVFGVPDTYKFMDDLHKSFRFLDPGLSAGRNALRLTGWSGELLSRLHPRARLFRQYADARLGKQRWLGSKLTKKRVKDLLAFDTRDFPEVSDKYLTDYSESGTSDLIDMLLYSRMINFEGNKVLGKCDELARRNGVGLINPFMDRRMLEFGFSIPNGLKHRSGQYRHLEITLSERYHHFKRNKSAFIAPFEEWLRLDPPDEARLSFDPADATRLGIFDPAALEAIWEEFQKKDSDLAWADIFAIISLEVWLRNLSAGRLERT